MSYANDITMALDGFNAFAQFDHEQEQRHWLDEGYRALGYSQTTRKDSSGLHIEHIYVKRTGEQVDGLPNHMVEKARGAIAAESAALQALQDVTRQATADIGRLGLSGNAAEYHLQLKRGEHWAAYQATQKPTRLALRDLGRLAEAAERIRTIRNAAPGKRDAIEQQAQALLAQVEAELDAANLEAAQLGLS